MKRVSLFFCITLVIFSMTFVTAQTFESVLNSGHFHKLSVEKEGLYKLDRNFFNQLKNESSTTLNPNNIVLYAAYGGELPLSNSADRIDDLSEVPMKFYGNNDNNFSEDEYFIFYSQGPSRTYYSESNSKFVHLTNPYDTKRFLFISIKDDRKQNVNKESLVSNFDLSVDYYDDYQRHEIDLINPLGKNFGTQGSGQEWYGESFEIERTQSFGSNFNFDNIINDSQIEVELEVIARGDASTSTRLLFNDQTRVKSISKTSSTNQYSRYANTTGMWRSTFDYSGNELSDLQIALQSSANPFKAWLNFIAITSKKSLLMKATPLKFQLIAGKDLTAIEFGIQNTNANTEIWKITDQFEVQEMNNSFSNGQSTFATTAGKVDQFIAFDTKMITDKPNYVAPVPSQNLHGIEKTEYIIVYNKIFENQAKELRLHRQTNDGIDGIIVDIDQIYNEFSGGAMDPVAIRDFAKLIYDRTSEFKYLCLMGDASYDYRGIDTELPFSNYVPCYETPGALDPVSSFPSDDFFTLLDDDEGGSLDGDLDIAVGRIPVSSAQEAQTVVDKLINYDLNPAYKGDWKNTAILVADDEDDNRHLAQSLDLSAQITSNSKEFEQRKIFFDAYKQESTIGDPRFPDAKKALNDAIFQGALFLNYFGHGGPNGWGQERVLEIQDILSWNNSTKLPVFITATCTFTGFDDAAVKSGGELTLLNPNGGTVGLISTVRAVQIGANGRLIESLFEFMFEKEENKYMPLSEILRQSKNSTNSGQTSDNYRKFALFSDPAFRLAIPNLAINLDKFQKLAVVEERTDTIHALEQIFLEGTIKDEAGQIQEDFNGTASITLRDKASQISTLGTDASSHVYAFESFNTTLFKGNTKVENGHWAIQFYVPKDINYAYGKGRINLYAINDKNEEARGLFDNFIIGGSIENGIADNNPPVLSGFMNNRTFKNGGTVGPNPIMLIDIEDDFGINLSNSAIGHEMIAILDGEEKNQILLNDFYIANEKSSAGTITYPFTNLSEGKHELFIRVWDIANNPAEITIEFTVEQGQINLLTNAYTWPNPSTDEVRFSFDHELNSNGLEIEIYIFNTAGQLITQIKDQINTGSKTIDNMTWNLQNQNGQKVQSGIYTYKIMASSLSTNNEYNIAESAGGKIVIIQ